MKAWLITWEWASDASAVADKVVGILNPLWGERRVSDIVEFLYSNTNNTVQELAKLAKNPRKNHYKASSFNKGISCGHNPYIWARIVSDLKIDTTDDGIETISWKEIPPYNVEKTIKPVTKKFTRRIRGPVSHKGIWDRSNNKFINGWGLGEIPEDGW